jgi:SAM-dependent methyltransferase
VGSEGRRLDPLAEAFAGSADSYDRARPGYEDEPLDWAFQELELDGRSVVLDLAAGTGKLLQALAPRAGQLIAVEPLAGMRRLLAARAPEATLLDGTAEQIVQLVLSWSFVAALTDADRQLLGRDLSQIVHNHAGDAPLGLPFVTYVYLTRKR